MQSLRNMQRRAVQELFRELSLKNNSQTLLHRQQLPNLGSLKNTTRATRRNLSTSPVSQSTHPTSQPRPRLSQQHQQSSPFFSSSPLRNRTKFSRRSHKQQTSRNSSTTANAGSPPPPEPEPTSLSARLKKLSREYGWSALGVYLLLSALDFPFCFLAVRTLGTERIGRWEHIVLHWVKESAKWPLEKLGWDVGVTGVDEGSKVVKQGVRDGLEKIEGEGPTKRLLDEKGSTGLGPKAEEWEDHGVDEAEKANTGETASTFQVLYIFHPPFIPHLKPPSPSLPSFTQTARSIHKQSN